MHYYSGLSILMQGVISLPNATLCDKLISMVMLWWAVRPLISGGSLKGVVRVYNRLWVSLTLYMLKMVLH